MNWEKVFSLLGEKGHVISLVGGGGKTTLMYALSSYCAAKGWRVLTSTTTHIMRPHDKEWIAVCEHTVGSIEDAVYKRNLLWQQGKYVIAGTCTENSKLTGLPEQIRNSWILDADITFLEADGAKRMPCKFPAAHEPVILPQSDIVLAVAGLSALYRPIGKVCFRADLAIEEWNREVLCSKYSKEKNLSRDNIVTPEFLAWLLGSKNGARKNTDGRKFYVILNQADTPKSVEDGKKVLAILKQKYNVDGILTSFPEEDRNQG